MSQDAKSVRAWLVERIADHTSTDPSRIQDDVQLTSYGLDSVIAVTLVVDIEERYELVLDPDTLWQYRTIDALTDLLAARMDGSGPS